jgi:predicted nucleic-acid-binding Zn-ribbon protein
MKDGICPKCGSEEVYVDSTRHGIIVPIAFTPHQTHLYICADCGYMEFYAQTGFDLQKVKERFRKAKG